MKVDIALYGSHNGAVALAIDGEIELVLEVERFLNQKNCGMFTYYVANINQYLLKAISEYITKHYGITEYDNVIQDYCDPDTVKKYFPAKKYHQPGHHIEHAAGSLYQSNHYQAIIVSYDGGGNDGFFNVYHGKRGEDIELLQACGLDMGFAYMSFGDRIEEITHMPLWLGNLVYPGKIMGLCAYGEVRGDWLPAFKEYYYSGPEGPTYEQRLAELGEKCDINFWPEDENEVKGRISGQLAYDVAATSQAAFELVFMELAGPWFDKHPDLPVHMSGGCGLNIILNTMLVNKGKDVFVCPNPNDCGLAVGMLCRFLKPKGVVDITYKGLPIMDEDMLYVYCEAGNAKPYNIDTLASELAAGKIVGIVRGRGEHGPRALGNRSILCNPAVAGMKDILNKKVKGREWYRPFAPVCKLEYVNKYFEWNNESRYMTFCPKVREEWKGLEAIVHVDGTARVQTVTKDQNEWLYELLDRFEHHAGHGVLLNTSFNVAGKPILSSYADAYKVFKETEMDQLLLGEYYFAK